MTTNRKITVTAWSDSQDLVIAETRTHRQFRQPAVIGLAGTLLLHSLVLQSALLGHWVHMIRPPEEQAHGSALNQTTSQPAESLVLINLPGIAESTHELIESPASARAAIKVDPITLSSADPLPPLDMQTLALDEENASEASIYSGDGAEQARLRGIYSGQIQARVDRIWSRPRTPVNDGNNPAKATNAVEYFHCQVQIVQDSIGNVKEILLLNCNGTTAWQRSLVLAIQQASPLPAPPSPTVFSRTMNLNFVGYPYVAGVSDQDYETLPVETAQVR